MSLELKLISAAFILIVILQLEVYRMIRRIERELDVMEQRLLKLELAVHEMQSQLDIDRRVITLEAKLPVKKTDRIVIES